MAFWGEVPVPKAEEASTTETMKTIRLRSTLKTSSKLTLFALFRLGTALKKRGHDVRQVHGKFILEHLGHHAKEQEAALAKAGAAELEALERLLHHLREVRAEHILAHGLRESTDRVDSNTTKLDLLALVRQDQEVLQVLHRRLEVWHEPILGGVGGATDGPNNDGLGGDRRGSEERIEALHDAGKVEVDMVMEDLEQGIKCGASRTLGIRIVDESHDSLNARCKPSEHGIPIRLTGTRTAWRVVHSSDSHSHMQQTATHEAFLTPASLSRSPASITGQTALRRGVINSLQPSTQIPKASIAPRRRLGSEEEKYSVMRLRRGGKTWPGGRPVASPSMMRSADYGTVRHLTIEGTKFVHAKVRRRRYPPVQLQS